MCRPASATKLPVAGFRRQREDTLSLCAGNDVRSRSFGSIVCRLPQDASRLGRRAAARRVGAQPSVARLLARRRAREPDQREGYHRLPCGQVVSKCALRDKKERSAPVSRNAPPISRWKYVSQKSVQFLRAHVDHSRIVLLQDRAFLNQPVRPGFPFLFPVPHLRFLKPVFCLEQFLFVFCQFHRSFLSKNHGLAVELKKAQPQALPLREVTVTALLFAVTSYESDSITGSNWQDHRLLMKSIATSRSSSLIVLSSDSAGCWIACSSADRPERPTSDDCRPSRIVSNTR